MKSAKSTALFWSVWSVGSFVMAALDFERGHYMAWAWIFNAVYAALIALRHQIRYDRLRDEAEKNLKDS